MTDGSVLLSVTAEVLFHDGTNWIRMDNNASVAQSHSGFALVKLVKSTNETFYRIIAIRNLDNKRIVDQQIFHRFKYKEATPSFHQWRNEHKQVIGLSFSNERDARYFYSGVRQVLDSILTLHQQQLIPISVKSQQDITTYQDPQNFHGYNCSHQHDIYSIGTNCSEDGNYMNAIDDKAAVMQTTTNGISNKSTIGQISMIPQQGLQMQQQHQNNLVRRASQGSNISSSTGGSLPYPNYGQQVLVIQQNTSSINNNSNNNNQCSSVSDFSCSNQQKIPIDRRQQPPMNQHVENNNHAHYQQTHNQAAFAPPPPPPPPPPPELKNALSAEKNSFADQLRLVQLRKNNGTNTTDKATLKMLPSSSTTSSNNSRENGVVGSNSKIQCGNQDLISELADRLNRRKLNSATVETSCEGAKTDGSITCQSKSVPIVNQIAAGKNNTMSAVPTIDQEVSDSSSCTDVAKTQIAFTGVTTADLAKFKIELMESFSAELSKLRREMTQQMCDEFAKILNKGQQK